MKKTALVTCMNIITGLLCAQQTIPLYDSIPNSKVSQITEQSDTSGGRLRISRVTVPTITMYEPKSSRGKNPAVIICPGGGYRSLAASHEGSEVARALADWGITAFVLKYRLPDDSIMINRSVGPLQDAQRAIQLVRQNAAKWNLDPQRIGIMGFSAGGHLAATTSTHFAEPVIENYQDIALRPDFSILIYPVISFTDSLAHMGSRNNLIGKAPAAADINKFSNELRVTEKTPPAFMVHAKNDNTVKVANSIEYYRALQSNHIEAELRLYPEGGHGFGMNNKTTTDPWMQWLKTWLINNHYL